MIIFTSYSFIQTTSPTPFSPRCGQMKRLTAFRSILHGRSIKSRLQTGLKNYGEIIMFIYKIKAVLFMAFLSLCGIAAANAQITNGGAIKFTVSHPFVIEDKTLPAGKYSITALSMPDGSDDILRLLSDDGKVSMFISTMEKIYGSPSKNTELVFDQVGDEYILKEIRLRGDEVAVEVPRTKSERQAEAAAGIN